MLRRAFLLLWRFLVRFYERDLLRRMIELEAREMKKAYEERRKK